VPEGWGFVDLDRAPDQISAGAIWQKGINRWLDENPSQRI